MSVTSSSYFLETADSEGRLACLEKSRDERSESGQFFTPTEIARYLATWFQVDGFNRSSLHLLDPGAGSGVLTAALVERIVDLCGKGELPKLQEVALEVWELDADFLPALRQNLDACAGILRGVAINATLQIHHGSYIEGASRALDEGLFSLPSNSEITHAILNPPYRKISIRSKERALLTSVGIETSNLYSAFVLLAFRQLVDGGELAAITPRSFCNGPYFREFRYELVRDAVFKRIHLFDSRSEAFGRDHVLQENILYHLSRTKPGKSPLILSTGSLVAPVLSRVDLDHFVSPSDPDRVFHLATERDSLEVRSFFEKLPCLLSDLDIQVSTGPVVDFRLKEFLSDQLNTGSVPLIYPHCVKGGKVLAPMSNSSAYENARINKKPVAIADNGETGKWLLQRDRYVLIKRFSSKEEKRRLVAGVLDPADFSSERLGIENHINFFHRKRAGLPEYLARGLTRFLNSTVADRYFRQFNGHTQVNATDLRAFRYPNIKSLERLGEASLDDSDQKKIDLAMTKQLEAPDFTAL